MRPFAPLRGAQGPKEVPAHPTLRPSPSSIPFVHPLRPSPSSIPFVHPRFIREAALGQSLKARHHVETDHLLRGLARIGRNLEQVARLTRTGPATALGKHVALARAEQHALVKRLVQNVQRGPRPSSR